MARHQYGGSFFWVNQAGQYPVPSSAFYMAGAGGQTTLVIPSHDLVVARLGHYSGSGPAGRRSGGRLHSSWRRCRKAEPGLARDTRPPGLEPGTLGLEGRCSIQLSYGRLGKLGFLIRGS